jgi:hypothetical protein
MARTGLVRCAVCQRDQRPPAGTQPWDYFSCRFCGHLIWHPQSPVPPAVRQALDEQWTARHGRPCQHL